MAKQIDENEKMEESDNNESESEDDITVHRLIMGNDDTIIAGRVDDPYDELRDNIKCDFIDPPLVVSTKRNNATITYFHAPKGKLYDMSLDSNSTVCIKGPAFNNDNEPIYFNKNLIIYDCDNIKHMVINGPKNSKSDNKKMVFNLYQNSPIEAIIMHGKKIPQQDHCEYQEVLDDSKVVHFHWEELPEIVEIYGHPNIESHESSTVMLGDTAGN